MRIPLIGPSGPRTAPRRAGGSRPASGRLFALPARDEFAPAPERRNAPAAAALDPGRVNRRDRIPDGLSDAVAGSAAPLVDSHLRAGNRFRGVAAVSRGQARASWFIDAGAGGADAPGRPGPDARPIAGGGLAARPAHDDDQRF